MTHEEFMMLCKEDRMQYLRDVNAGKVPPIEDPLPPKEDRPLKDD
jgi:hypothetical protein